MTVVMGGDSLFSAAPQMYSGLSIATAKVTPDEARGVRHHLIGHLEPTDQQTVKGFSALASDCIADILARGKLPIVVGGTTYYCQALLRPAASTLDEEVLARRVISRAAAAPSGAAHASAVGADECKTAPAPVVTIPPPRKYSDDWAMSCTTPAPELHRQLESVDPVMARRLHPNDGRKVCAPWCACGSSQAHKQAADSSQFDRA